MSFDQNSFVWLNGQLLPHLEGVTQVSAHVLHYGTGVFEGIRCYETADGPALFRMDAHMDRLFASAAVYGIAMPYSREELTNAACEVIRKNGFTRCYVRPVCYLGTKTLGIGAKCPTEAAILVVPEMGKVTEDAKSHGIRLMISSWTKIDRTMVPSTAKACGQYLNSRLATQEAASHGYDEALLLNAVGNVAEAAVANVFIVKNGVVRTNDQSSSILLGITRDTAVTLAQSLGLSVEIGDISVEALRGADEVFLTGTAKEIVAVTEVHGQAIGNGARGKITRTIQEAFAAATQGQDARRRHWLHAVAQPQPAR
ncbi:MAG: branched-chain-amino-acid transaminase [Candidatus Acidiferrum sp.]